MADDDGGPGRRDRDQSHERIMEHELGLLEREAGGSNLVGYAMVKYSAVVIIVLAVLAFLAVYILPLLT